MNVTKEQLQYEKNGSRIDDKNIVVLVRNAFKTFNVGRSNELEIFRNLNLTVQEGTIYGLLGPSGCGKSTMMKCIMSRVKLDSGLLLTYGAVPGSKKSGIPGKHVGYMPQEPALYDTMTIAETLKFYGAVAGLTNSYIKSRTKFFINNLCMPPKETLNRNLSGGQLRRLSFIAALLSQPRLIILDEPTVGVDPIVRLKMWKYLEDVVAKDNVTIILSTHFIEEARNVNTVGMMRGGRLLVEASPNDLMRRYDCTTLEDVFLKACEQCNGGYIAEDNDNDQANNRCHLSDDLIRNNQRHVGDTTNWDNVCAKKSLFNRVMGENFLDHIRIPQPRRLWAVAMKNIIGFIRFPGSLLFVCGLPGFLLMLACIAFNHILDNTTIGLLNEDSGSWGTEYLKHLNPLYQKVNFETFDSGYTAVKDGKLLALIQVSKNFTKSMLNAANAGIMDRVAFSAENQNQVIVTTDSSQLSAKYLGMELLYSFYNSSELIFKKMGYNASSFFAPVAIDEKTAHWLNQPESVFIVPPLLVCLPFMIQIAASVLSLFIDKSKGYLDRCFSSGITGVEILSGFFFVQSGVIVVQITILLTIAFAGFGIDMVGSVPLLFALIFTSAIVGTAQGVFWSIAFRDVTTMMVYAICFVFFVIVFCGLFYPISAAPYWFRVLQWMLPFEYPASAAYNIMYRGWTLRHFDVIISFVIMGAWIAINFSLSLISLKFLRPV